MKRLLPLLFSFLLATTVYAAPFQLQQIASTTQANPYLGWLSGDGNANHIATASTSPFFSSLTFGTATGTSATTTNFFSTTASSSNLFAALFNGAGLTTCTAGTQKLNWAAGLFSCGTISGVASSTLLGDNNHFTGTNTFDNITTFSQILANSSTTLQNFTGLNSTTTNATTTTLFSPLASTTNLYLGVGPCSGSNALQTSNGKVVCGAVTVANAASSTLLADNNHFTGLNIFTASTTIGDGTTSGGLTVSGQATTTNLIVTGSSTLGNFTFNNATGTSATTTNLFSTTASSSKLFTANFNGAGLSTCTGASQGLQWSGGLFLCTTLSGFASSTLLGDNNRFTGGNIFYASTTIGNGTTQGGLTVFGTATTTNLIVLSSSTLANFTFNNATGTQATTSNLFSTFASTTNLFFTTANGGNLTSTGLVAASNLLSNGSSTLQNWTGLNSTSTNATTTTIFSNIASTTKLFLATGNGCLSVTSGLVTTTGAACGSSSGGGNSKWATSTATGYPTDKGIFPNGGVNVNVGIGTSTPQWQLTIASSTGFQVNLRDTTLTSNGFGFRSVGNFMYISTTSPTTFASSTTSYLVFDDIGGLIMQNSTTSSATTTNIFSTTASTTKLFLATGNGCLQVTSGLIGSTGSACGTSVYSANSKWATSTTTNYPTDKGIYPNGTNINVGIGTTTPRWSLQIASSTGPQFALTDGTTNNHWTFRNAGGILYIGTSSPSTFATSTLPAFMIDRQGNVGIGTSTPWGAFSIASTTPDDVSPLFVISTSTNPKGSLFSVISSSTSALSNGYGSTTKSATNVVIGHQKSLGELTDSSLDTLYVDGPVGSNMELVANCSGGTLVSSTGTDASNACGAWGWQEDTNSNMQQNSFTGDAVVQLQVSSSISDDGSMLYFGNIGAWLRFASTTPIMQGIVGLGSVASTTAFYMGFTNVSAGGTTFEVPPTVGCYFTASSTKANWQAVCQTSAPNTTQIDTGIASSTSPTSAGGFVKFRIEADKTTTRFYMRDTRSETYSFVATMTTNLPNNSNSIGAQTYVANTSSGTTRNFYVNSLQLYLKRNPQ